MSTCQASLDVLPSIVFTGNLKKYNYVRFVFFAFVPAFFLVVVFTIFQSETAFFIASYFTWAPPLYH